MAYFDCIVGGSSGKWKLTVTCTNVFAGLTITCTDGTTTLTKTCPSSSPYTVVFNIPNGGTWTISGTASGQTGTTTVIIPDSAILNPPIPTGSTVTPVNDIQIWLHCANIWDKTYTTINQVLADTSTLLALISSNNAADYMARSTEWASSVCANQTAMGYIGNNNYCANKLLANSTWINAICNSTYFESVLDVKVPTMTDTTLPSGRVLASGNSSSGTAAWRAFDGSLSSGWEYTPVTSAWIGYQFTSAVKIYAVEMKNDASNSTFMNRLPKEYVLQYSDDGSTWNNIATLTNQKIATNRLATNLTSGTHLYYRAKINSNFGDTYVRISQLQFYGRA